MSRRPVVLAAVLTCALAAAFFGAFATKQRELIAGVPSPRPLFEIALVEVPPGELLCIAGVTIPDNARQLRIQVGTSGRPGPELDVALRARDYEERLTVPGGYRDATLIGVAMNPPPAARLGEVCLSHQGSEPIGLVGSREGRTLSRPEAKVGEALQTTDTFLAFYDRGSASALDRTAAIVDRMTAFRPAIVGSWVVWTLLGLVVVGVPVGVVWAALCAVRS